MLLFNRSASLIVGQRKFNVRLKFHVEATQAGSDPTKCQCSAYNLSSESMNYVQGLKGTQNVFFISAGYGGKNKIIFGGNIYYVDSTRSGPDVVTTFHSQSGLAFVQQAHFEVSSAMSDLDIYNQIANALSSFGLSKGSLSAKASSMLASGTYSTPYSGSNSGAYFLDLIVKRHNLKWSLNLQKLDVYVPSEASNPQIVVLSPTTGMIGFPTKTKQGAFKIRSLLNGDLMPGRLFQLQSKEISAPGNMIVYKATHDGDTLEGDYYTEIETAVLAFQPSLAAFQ